MTETLSTQSPRRLLSAVLLIALLGIPVAAMADAPGFVPAQGVLYDDAGVPHDGSLDVTFRLTSDSSGTTTLWTEAQTVSFVGGLFNVYLGTSNPLDTTVFRDNDELYLGITVDGDSEMALIPFGTNGYAGWADYCGDAETLGGQTPDDIVTDAVADAMMSGDTAYAPVDHEHDWDDITTGVPSGFADGVDNDTVGGLTCMANSLPLYDGMNWVCAPLTDTDTLAGLGCDSGQIARYQGGSWICDDDREGAGDITGVTAGSGLSGGGSSGDVSLSFDVAFGDGRYVNEGQTNSVTSVMITNGAVGTADIEDGSVSTTDIANGTITNADISGSAGIAMSKIAAPAGCSAGDVLQWTGSSWGCVRLPTQDVRTGTSSISGLTVGRRYLVTVYGYTHNHGNDTSTLGAVRVETTGGSLLAQTATQSINWHDGQAPQSASVVITATTSSIQAFTCYHSFSNRVSARNMVAVELAD